MTPAQYKEKSDSKFLEKVPDEKMLYRYGGWFVCMPDEGFNYTEYNEHEVLAHYLIAPKTSDEFIDNFWYEVVAFKLCLEWLSGRLKDKKYVIRIVSVAARSVDHFHCHVLHLGKKLREQKHGKPNKG